MKKLLLIALASFFVISCRKDDESEETKPSFVGTWKWTKSVILSGKDNSVISSDPVLSSECESKNSYVYTSEGKFTFNHFTFANNTCENNTTLAGDYSYDENNKLLTLKQLINLTQINRSYYLNSFTNNEMQVISEDNKDYNNDGINDKSITVLTK